MAVGTEFCAVARVHAGKRTFFPGVCGLGVCCFLFLNGLLAVALPAGSCQHYVELALLHFFCGGSRGMSRVCASVSLRFSVWRIVRIFLACSLRAGCFSACMHAYLALS